MRLLAYGLALSWASAARAAHDLDGRDIFSNRY